MRLVKGSQDMAEKADERSERRMISEESTEQWWEQMDGIPGHVIVIAVAILSILLVFSSMDFYL